MFSDMFVVEVGDAQVAMAGNRRADQVDQMGTIPEIIRVGSVRFAKQKRVWIHESRGRCSGAGIPTVLGF